MSDRSCLRDCGLNVVRTLPGVALARGPCRALSPCPCPLFRIPVPGVCAVWRRLVPHVVTRTMMWPGTTLK
eukprot:7205855-Prymnesium_polylepis.2